MRLVKFEMPEQVDQVLIFAEDETDEMLLGCVADFMGDEWQDADYETIMTADSSISGINTMRPFVG